MRPDEILAKEVKKGCVKCGTNYTPWWNMMQDGSLVCAKCFQDAQFELNKKRAEEEKKLWKPEAWVG